MSAVAEAQLLPFAHLQFTDAGRRRLDEVKVFLDQLEAGGHPLASRAKSELVERLMFLDGFGGPVSETDTRRRFRVTLGSDLYPLSFTVTWESIDRETGDYRFSMNGGLVWHGGPGDSGSVCLEPEVLWGIHT